MQEQTPETYETTAERYWRTFLPTQVAAMEDPTTFFRGLADQVRSRVRGAVATADVEASLPENPTYAQIRAAHEGVRQAAEEAAMADLVFLPPEPGTESRRPEGLVLPGWEDEPTETPTPPSSPAV